VERAPNAVLHPWLIEQLGEILAELPPLVAGAPAPGLEWSEWGYAERTAPGQPAPPPIRAVLVWDNLAGHKSDEIVNWCVAQGVLPLYTPIGGSWLNMAESVQRILVRRALAGQQPESAAEVMEWLAATVRGWNEAPTAFAWGGKRRERRRRAWERRHGAGGSGAYTRRPIPRPRRSSLDRALNGYIHDN
jgi:transposase